MGISFLTPLGAVFAVTALSLLAVFTARRRRMRTLRSALGLGEPPLKRQVVPAVALVAVPALLGLAASQPVIETDLVRAERTDAQVFMVVDTSRSMLAAAEPGEATRFDRARRIAEQVRDQLPEVPVGIASFTAGVLPHLFPTTDLRTFDATLERAVGVGQTPTSGFFLKLATDLNGLADVAKLNYFPASAQRRVLVVLTDGESAPLQGDLVAAFRRRPRIQTIFVRIWEADERIYETGVAEGGYVPDPKSASVLGRFASALGGRVHSEDQASDVVATVREDLGKGPIVKRKHEAGRLALMPYVVLLALLPLGFVLVRRNLWWRGLPRFPLGLGRVAVPAPEGAKVSEPRGVAQPG